MPCGMGQNTHGYFRLVLASRSATWRKRTTIFATSRQSFSSLILMNFRNFQNINIVICFHACGDLRGRTCRCACAPKPTLEVRAMSG